MTNTKKRGPDAQDDDAPKAGSAATHDRDQDAPNYEKRTDKGEALQVEDVNSANDEGAG